MAFVSALTASLLVLLLGGSTQPAPKAARLGIVRPAEDNHVFRSQFEGCRQVLRESGRVEGQNLDIEYRVKPGSRDEVFASARELVGLKVDAMLAIGPLGVAAAVQATSFIPIVALDLETDPVALGFAKSLGRPGRNVTGVFLDFPELSGKWLQMLTEVIPKLSRVAVLWDPATGPAQVKAAEVAAQRLRLQIQLHEARSADDLGAAVQAAGRERAGALLVLGSPTFNSSRKRLAELTNKARLPTIMPFPDFAKEGGLMAYGPHLQRLYNQTCEMVVKVLNGFAPGDIPVERPTTFNLIVNLRTAKALDIVIPPSLLAGAHEIIQ